MNSHRDVTRGDCREWIDSRQSSPMNSEVRFRVKRSFQIDPRAGDLRDKAHLYGAIFAIPNQGKACQSSSTLRLGKLSHA